MSLPALIIENWGAVEADLSTYHQVNDPLSLTWRRLATLVRHLPASGAFIRSLIPIRPPDKTASGTAGEESGEGAPEWLREYNRIQSIKADYVDLDMMREGSLPGGERRVSG